MRHTLLALSAALTLVSSHAFAAYQNDGKLAINVEDYSYDSGSWSGASHQFLSDGIRFSTNEYVGGGDSGYWEGGGAWFNIGYLSFAAQAGYEITGYELTLHGYASAERDGSTSVNGGFNGGNFDSAYYQYHNGEYTLVISTTPASPAGGEVSVYGNIGYEAPYSYYLEYDEYGYPIGDVVTMSGRASNFLDSVTIRARIVAVPEPENFALLLAGLGIVGWRVRRIARG